AKRHADLLRVFLDDVPAAGVLDGHVRLHSRGMDGSGSIDLKLKGAAYASAVGKEAAPGGDLVLAARFERTGDRMKLDGLHVAAEGLAVDGSRAGSWDAVSGETKVDVDLARLLAAVRAAGINLGDASVTGRLAGSMKFTESPSKGAGEFTLTGFSAAGLLP